MNKDNKEIIEKFNDDFNKMVESRNSTLNEVESYCKLHPELLDKLQIDLKDIKSYQYGRLSKDNMKLVNKYVNEIIMNDTKLSQLFQSFLDGILNHQNKLISINKELGRSIPHKYKIFFKERKELFYNRVGNIILKELKENLFKERIYV